MKIDWQAEFPRIFELSTELDIASAYHGWFESQLNNTHRHAPRLDFLARLESSLSAVDDQAWGQLKAKIKKQQKSTRRELISLFGEAEGFSYFKQELRTRRITYDEIREPDPIRMSKGKIPEAPEWVAVYRGAIVAAVEVKTVFNSDDQTNYISSNTERLKSGLPPIIKRLVPEIPATLLAKLDSVVSKAKSQLRAVPGELKLRIVYLIVNVDDEVAEARECRQRLCDHLLRLLEEDIAIVGILRGPLL